MSALENLHTRELRAEKLFNIKYEVISIERHRPNQCEITPPNLPPPWGSRCRPGGISNPVTQQEIKSMTSKWLLIQEEVILEVERQPQRRGNGHEAGPSTSLHDWRDSRRVGATIQPIWAEPWKNRRSRDLLLLRAARWGFTQAEVR